MTVDVIKPALTNSLEDYLETIFQLVSRQNYARVKDIARARDVKAGSVSPALKRLAEMGLVNYVRREYVTLTDEGEVEARRIYARHQILTRFFQQILKLPLELAERDACSMEHSLSSEGMDGLVRFFEFLGACPEGSAEFLDRFHSCSLIQGDRDSCPKVCEQDSGRSDGPQIASRSVYDLKPGQQGFVTHVHAQGAIRQRLLDMGVLPEARIRVERIAPAGEPIWIELDGTQLALRRQEAEAVLVSDARS